MPITNYLPSSRLIQPGVCTSSTRPASPYEGMVIYETDTNKTFVYSGSAWVMMVSADTPPGLELIKTQTIGSAVASVTVTSAFSATYDNYQIVISGVSPSGSGGWYQFQFDSGHTNNYYGAARAVNNSGTVVEQATNNLGRLLIGRTSNSANQDSMSFTVSMPFNSTRKGIHGTASGDLGFVLHGGSYANEASFSQFVFAHPGGTVTGGTIYVYGYRKS